MAVLAAMETATLSLSLASCLRIPLIHLRSVSLDWLVSPCQMSFSIFLLISVVTPSTMYCSNGSSLELAPMRTRYSAYLPSRESGQMSIFTLMMAVVMVLWVSVAEPKAVKPHPLPSWRVGLSSR